MSRATIRPATVDDAAAIAHAHVESWRAAYAGIVPQAHLDNLSEERRTAFWADALTGNGDPIDTWVAEVDGRIVGFAGTMEPEARDREDGPAGAMELATIYLLPDAWGRGIGQALHRAVVAHHRAAGTPELMLWVLTANDRARRFYERAGWTADGAARDLPIGGAPLPIVRYRLALGTGDEAST